MQLKALIDQLNSPSKTKLAFSANKSPRSPKYARGGGQTSPRTKPPSNVPTLDYKGRINKDMFEHYPGLY